MPIESVPPKYVAIVSAIQARIQSGAYRPGQLLPSEAQLVREFAASRSTVVRALQFLRQQRWLEGIHGKRKVGGSTPPLPTSSSPGLHDPDQRQRGRGLLLRLLVDL